MSECAAEVGACMAPDSVEPAAEAEAETEDQTEAEAEAEDPVVTVTVAPSSAAHVTAGAAVLAAIATLM